MVVAWYRGDGSSDENCLLPDPAMIISSEEVREKTGITCLKFSADTWSTDKNYADLKERNGFDYEDTCELSRAALPDYDEVIKTISTEHIHPDDEIRFVIEGSGYFDARDWDDRWIRLHISRDDLIIIPAGLYHRFVLDKTEYINVKRLFSGTPVWTAFFRPDGDTHPVRKEYLKRMDELKKRTGGK